MPLFFILALLLQLLPSEKINLPERDKNAPTASELVLKLEKLPFEQREEVIINEILSGNIPTFMRNFIELKYTIHNKEVAFYTLPDYLSIGSDSDFLRVPMTPLAAQIIADSLNCSLPTTLLVDEIAKASTGAIDPFPFRPVGNRNESVATFEDSNNAINALFKASGYKFGELISGLKKDVVISSKIALDSSRVNHVTIYGWHYADGSYIQPSTNIHINSYVDYSHGIRLLLRAVKIDGKLYDIQDVLKDSKLFKYLSKESTPMIKPTYKGDLLHSR